MRTFVRQSSTFGLLLCVLIAAPLSVGAQEATTTTDTTDRATVLQTLIDERTRAIQDLEAQIGQYQDQLKQIDGQKKTLQNQIKSYDITRKKLIADLAVTQDKIVQTNYRLEALSMDIKDKQARMDAGRSTIAEGIQSINEYDSRSFLESILTTETFTEVWSDIDSIQSLQNGVRAHIAVLNTMKSDLQDKQAQSLKIKSSLLALQKQLASQKKVVEYNTQQKNALLTTTKNSESNYQKILKEKMALRDSFEQELLGFESELKLITNQSQIPGAEHGMLAWPLDSIAITQYFGNTSFAAANPQIYNGQGHNGIDFRASIGTPIKSAAGGEVEGTGNTDTTCPGASYGKWVLVRHQNGLSTLYAHLSVISVSQGDTVTTGEIIGYSGNTGYSTGPHLHFTVYATAGVEITNRQSRVCGGTYRMPIADLRAYLNPLSYLPALP